MVDALTEIHRTLRPGASLLDLRPFLPFGPLELVLDHSVSVLGRLDETKYDEADVAADEALAEVFRRNLFTLEATDSFWYAAYWDTIPELREYLKDWAETAHLSRRLAGIARRALRDATGSRLRLRTYMVVNRLRKAG